MRTNVGNGDGVTRASMSPEISSTTTRPTATATTPLARSASTSERGRLPGEITDQPSCMPTPAARKIAVSSSSPCGVSNPKKMSPLPASNMKPPITPRFSAFWKSANGIGMPSRIAEAMHCSVTHELLTHTCAANEPAGFSL
jgi:hypothetical protein